MRLKNDEHIFSEEMDRRSISYLVHFTKAINLIGIFQQEKLLSCDALDEASELCPDLYMEDYIKHNDSIRLDHRRSHINLSVQFPNNFLFKRFQEADADGEWAVLLLSREVVRWEGTLFSVYNAAAASSRQYGIGGSLDHFKNLFLDPIDIQYHWGKRSYAREGLRNCYPTSAQAEVLVQDSIAASQIKEVCFKSKHALSHWKSALQTVDLEQGVEMTVRPEFWGSERR